MASRAGYTEDHDVAMATTPLQAPPTAGMHGPPGISPAGQRKGRGGCRLCCGSLFKPHDHKDNRKNKAIAKKRGPDQSNYGDYTFSTIGLERKDGTMGSGITGLSQLQGIPRYTDDGSEDEDSTDEVGGKDSDVEVEDKHDLAASQRSKPAKSSSCCAGKGSSCCGGRKQSSDGDSLEKPTGKTRAEKENGKDKEKGEKGKCVSFLFFLINAFFSLVGLTGMVAGYAIGGAFLFEYLERDYEQEVKRDMFENRNKTVDRLWNLTTRLNVFDPAEWKKMAYTELESFTDDLHHSFVNGWDGSNDVNAPPSWSFGSALLYSVTVVTTIGYGNITPKTMLGRYVTILYAIVGIPLCLIWLTSCGAVMATAFRYLYRKMGQFCRGRILNCGVRKYKEGRSQVRVPVTVSIIVIVLYILLGAVLYNQWEGWDFDVAAYFCFITLATIGFGDYVPGYGSDQGDMKAICATLYLIVGMIIIAMSFDLMREEVQMKFQTFLQVCCCHKKRGVKTPNNSSSSSSNKNASDKAPPEDHEGIDYIELALKEEEVQPGGGLSRATYSSKSMRALSTSSGYEDDFQSKLLAQRSRVYSISALTNTRYGPLPHHGDGGELNFGEAEEETTAMCMTWSEGAYRPVTLNAIPTRNPSNSTNNNHSNVNHNNRSARGDYSGMRSRTPGPQMVSTPADDLAERVDLLETMNLLHPSSAASPPPSPKMLRRDRSRSPVRARPKSRGGPGAHDRGGNVDVATEDEDEIEDEEDDDDTLDAASLASSTDLIKVAHAVRRASSKHGGSPSPFKLDEEEEEEDDDPHLHPAYGSRSHHQPPHPYTTASMSTFRPHPPSQQPSRSSPPQLQQQQQQQHHQQQDQQQQGFTQAPTSTTTAPTTTSRPPSRSQSRAASSSPSSSSTSSSLVQRATYPYDVTSSSALRSSTPSSTTPPVQRSTYPYDGVMSATTLPCSSRPPSGSSDAAAAAVRHKNEGVVLGQEALEQSVDSFSEEEEDGEEETASVVSFPSPSAFSKPRPPTSPGHGGEDEPEHYAQPPLEQQQQQQQQQRQQQQQQQQQQQRQQHQQLPRQQQLQMQQPRQIQQQQQHLREQQQQQQHQLQQQQKEQQQLLHQQHLPVQQQLQQRQQQLQQQQQQQQRQYQQANKVHSSDHVLPARCVSPMPKMSKTAQHKVSPPPPPPVPVTVADAKRPPPPTLPKTKKMGFVSQPL